MTLRESLEKLLTLSTVADEQGADATICFTTPQMLDAKAVGWHTSRAEPGKACNTCIHYHLVVELEEDQSVPPEPQHDYDERELINLVKLPIYFGYCTKLQEKHNLLLYGIRSDHGCVYYEERNPNEQFDDNVIEEDDGRTPVVPTIVIGI